MRLEFYFGPGNLVTDIIRLITHGPYSHVELQFRDGCRFFASGHGDFTGSHLICDHKIYGKFWDSIYIKATRQQEASAERFVKNLVGFPFDWRGMLSFLLPFMYRDRKGKYCSSIVLDVLQSTLHKFPGVRMKISPNNLYQLFVDDTEAGG